MKILLAFILILALFFIVVMVIDCNRFVIREYCCEDKRLKKPLKIVQLSDLHNKSFGKDILAQQGKQADPRHKTSMSL